MFNANRPVGAAANTSYNLAVTDKGFKFPQLFRTNLAVDQKLPFDIVATLEGLFSKDINGVYPSEYQSSSYWYCASRLR
jgi:hypothetical protein